MCVCVCVTRLRESCTRLVLRSFWVGHSEENEHERGRMSVTSNRLRCWPQVEAALAIAGCKCQSSIVIGWRKRQWRRCDMEEKEETTTNENGETFRGKGATRVVTKVEKVGRQTAGCDTPNVNGRGRQSGRNSTNEKGKEDVNMM